MKQNKLFFVSVVCSLLMFSGCEESEELNLLTYPENQASASITDAEGNSEVTLKATYNGEGELELDGEASRTYMFRFNASPEDILISYELISTNIPEELVQISKTEDKLPKGSTDALVDVSFLADDFSFAKTNYDEETYEIGVKASAVGYKIPTEPLQAKVIVQKEAFSSSCFIVGDESSNTIIEKAYLDGKYLDDTPIAYQFTVQLDKPAISDLSVKISLTGLDEDVLDKVTLDNEIVIPKGKKSTELISCVFDKDFLLQSELDEYKFSFSIMAEDKYVSIDENRSKVDLIVRKVMRNISYSDEIKADWEEMTNKNAWSVELLFSTWANPRNLIDGRGGRYGTNISRSEKDFSFILDLSQEESIKGLGIDYYENWYSGVCSPKRIKISTSLDKEEWVDQGEIETPNEYNHYIQFLSSLSTRYLKFELYDRYSDYIGPTEIYVYK